MLLAKVPAASPAVCGPPARRHVRPTRRSCGTLRSVVGRRAHAARLLRRRGLGGGGDPAAPRAGARGHLPDLKRSNQISIASPSSAPHAEVRDAILALDEGLIKLEDIARLRACVPTPEEAELLAPYLEGGEYQSSQASLASADLFLAYMCAIPRLLPRLECFHTKLSLPGRASDLSGQIDAIDAAAACVQRSTTLPQLLQLVLATGNVLNAGTPKGNAKGFRLEVLQKLGETKSSPGAVEPQMSLLHHLAAVAMAASADVAKALHKECAPLAEAASLQVAAVADEAKSLRGELEVVQREAPLVGAGAAGAADRFRR